MSVWRSHFPCPFTSDNCPLICSTLPRPSRTLALAHTRAISSKPYLCKNQYDSSSSSSSSSSPLVPPPTWSIHHLRLLHKDAGAGGGSDALSEEEVGRTEMGGTLVPI